MVLTALALVVGLLVGRLAAPLSRHVAEPRLRVLSLLIAGLAIQVAARPLDVNALLPLSYAVLAAFVVLNLRLVGMPVVLVGLALNLGVIVVNGGMPVRGDALVATGLAERHELPGLQLAGGRHLERGGDVLPALGDTIPVTPLRQVVSFGDLILLVGIADVVAHLARRRAVQRPPRSSARAASWPSPPAQESVMLPVFGVGDRVAADAPNDEGVDMTAAETGIPPLVVSADRVT